MAYTPVWGTGFEVGSLVLENFTYSGTVTLETSTVHNGSYGLKLYGASAPDAVVTLDFGSIVGAQQEIYVSAWIRAGSSGDEPTQLYILTSDDYKVGISHDGTYWDAVVNGSGVESGSVSAAAGEWHLVELYVKIDNAAGAIQTKIDGTADIDYSGDTQPGTSADGDSVQMIQGGAVADNPTSYLDDITIATGDWVGDVRYDAALVPTADTVQKEWTPSTGSTNYSLVDELPPSDDDYVSTGSTGYTDLYEIADWTPANESYNIEFLVDWLRARKGTAADQQIRSVVKSGSTESSGGSISLSTTFTCYQRILTTDPDTSADWDTTGVNALQIGQEYL